MFPVGVPWLGAALLAEKVWVWAGSSEIINVWFSSPPVSPSVWLLPKWIGIRPCRFGNAKLTRPSPPYVVPSRENNAWFWLIGNNWPLHSAQPLGAKLKLTILITDKKRSDMAWAPYVGEG